MLLHYHLSPLYVPAAAVAALILFFAVIGAVALLWRYAALTAAIDSAMLMSLRV